jgi:hypothetical protein
MAGAEPSDARVRPPTAEPERSNQPIGLCRTRVFPRPLVVIMVARKRSKMEQNRKTIQPNLKSPTCVPQAPPPSTGSVLALPTGMPASSRDETESDAALLLVLAATTTVPPAWPRCSCMTRGSCCVRLVLGGNGVDRSHHL